MKTLTHKSKFYYVVINYAEKYGVTRQYIYQWGKKYSGALSSLVDKSYKSRIKANLRYEKEKFLYKSRGVVG